MSIDLDNDGLCDIQMYYFIQSPGTVFSYIASLHPDSLQLCFMEPDGIIAENDNWFSRINFEHVWKYDRYGFRFVQNNSNIYGWFETYKTSDSWAFDRTALCTIPDYPLQCGQTAFTDIGEDLSDGFVSVRPNPTSDVVTVSGENLKQAEVRNVVGQTVAVKKAEGEELFFDFSTQPAGLYFITVTGQNGERCVKKVVKQ